MRKKNEKKRTRRLIMRIDKSMYDTKTNIGRRKTKGQN